MHMRICIYFGRGLTKKRERGQRKEGEVKQRISPVGYPVPGEGQRESFSFESGACRHVIFCHLCSFCSSHILCIVMRHRLMCMSQCHLSVPCFSAMGIYEFPVVRLLFTVLHLSRLRLCGVRVPFFSSRLPTLMAANEFVCDDQCRDSLIIIIAWERLCLLV